jgi:hypothetical protein
VVAAQGVPTALAFVAALAAGLGIVTFSRRAGRVSGP